MLRSQYNNFSSRKFQALNSFSIKIESCYCQFSVQYFEPLPLCVSSMKRNEVQPENQHDHASIISRLSSLRLCIFGLCSSLLCNL